MAQAVDFSFSRPAPAAIKAAGCAGVLRYICAELAKRITVAEHLTYRAAGIPVALVYEDGAGDFAGGANAGAAKAVIAAPQLVALAWPKDRPVYAAIDENLPVALYQLAYEGIHAFASALGRPDAIYGPRPFGYWAWKTHGVEYFWELGSSSFNDGPEPPSKRLQQLVGGSPIGGASVDYNTVLAEDWGQFPYTAPVPAPKPPAPHVAPSPPKPSPTPEVAKVLHTVTGKIGANGEVIIDTSIPWANRQAATPQTEDGAQSTASVRWTNAADMVRLVVHGEPNENVSIDVLATA